MSLSKAFGSIEGQLIEVSDPTSCWLFTTTEFSGHVAQFIKELGSSNQEALAVDITPNMAYIGMVSQACYPSTWEVEVRKSESQHHPQLHNEFEASLKYTRPHVKQTKITFWMMFSFFLSLKLHNLILALSLPQSRVRLKFHITSGLVRIQGKLGVWSWSSPDLRPQ